jgi:uncharacterized membrane protein YvlD (DUF360 family)
MVIIRSSKLPNVGIFGLYMNISGIVGVTHTVPNSLLNSGYFSLVDNSVHEYIVACFLRNATVIRGFLGLVTLLLALSLG